MRAKKKHFIYQLDEKLCPQNYAPKNDWFFDVSPFKHGYFGLSMGANCHSKPCEFHKSAGPGRPGHPASFIAKNIGN